MSDHEGVVNTVSNREGVLKTRCKSCDVLKRSVAIVQATAEWHGENGQILAALISIQCKCMKDTVRLGC